MLHDFISIGHGHGHRPAGGAQHHIHRSTADLIDPTIGVPGALVQGESGSHLIHGDFNSETPATDMLTPDQIDAILMRHDQVSFWWIIWHKRVTLLNNEHT